MGNRYAALLSAALLACGGKTTSESISPPAPAILDDAGTPDGGTPVPDAGTPDAGTSAPDAGVTQTRLAAPQAGSLYHGVLPYSKSDTETDVGPDALDGYVSAAGRNVA